MTSEHHRPPAYDEVDPFELPEWLGQGEVTWTADRSLATGHRVSGTLTAEGGSVPCDLLAVDEAFPEPVADDTARVRAHQAWRHGEVLVVSDGGRIVLAIPGSRLEAGTALDAVGRLARAVGAPAASYAIRLRTASDQSP
ncbi:MAG: hypothetical protein WB797_14540 [Nocardioides sp.]